jgi:hypothetical protein
MRDTFVRTACRTAVALAMCGSVLGIASFTVAEFARIQSPSASSDGRSGILANSATRVDLPVSDSQLSFLQTDPDSAVESGRDALGSGGRFPWYDSARDDLRPIDLQADDDNSSPDSSNDRRSEGGGPSGNSSRRGGGSGSGNGSGRGSDSGSSRDESPSVSIDPQAVSAPALMWIAWIGIAGVLLWIVYMIIKAFLDREARDAKTSESTDDEEESGPAGLDALPARVVVAKGGLLDEARRQYEAGNHNLAIIYLYSYELIKLDQNQMLRLAKGKTNREYLRELSGRPEIYGIVARTLVPFEDVFFGEHQLTRERFEACWNQVDRFNRLIEQAAA